MKEKRNKNYALSIILVLAFLLILTIGAIVILPASNHMNDKQNEEIKQKTLFEVAIENSEASSFVNSILIANFANNLNSNVKTYTVFAPNNSSFSKLEESQDSLPIPHTQLELLGVLQNHIVSDQLLSSELYDGQVLVTLSGSQLKIKIENEEVFIVGENSRAKVITSDIRAANGVIHLIDQVIR